MHPEVPQNSPEDLSQEWDRATVVKAETRPPLSLSLFGFVRYKYLSSLKKEMESKEIDIYMALYNQLAEIYTPTFCHFFKVSGVNFGERITGFNFHRNSGRHFGCRWATIRGGDIHQYETRRWVNCITHQRKLALSVNNYRNRLVSDLAINFLKV
ncbi:hypothetical protein J6590_089314 [Homalodisca vitripennis]|nr:hypothetical protein J6590_089314 [Homalodisca vitripennis]